FSDLNASVGCARSAAARAIAFVSVEEWEPARARLVNTILDGVNSDLLRPRVFEAASDWFPLSCRWINTIFEAMSEWQPRSDATNALVIGVGNDRISDRHAAARTLAKLAGDDSVVGATLTEMLFCGEPGTA